MSRLKKYDEYMKEQDQHRVESEKDVVIQNQIADLSSDDVNTSDITSVDLSAGQIDSLRNANDVHEDVDTDDIDPINEGAVKNLLEDIKEVLKGLVSDADEDYHKFTHSNMENDPFGSYAQEILSLCSQSTNESNSNFDPTKPAFSFSINVDGLSRQRAEQQIAQLLEDYKDDNYNMFIVPIKEGDSKVECIWNPTNETLTEQEDIPQIILDQEKARRFKETKDTLDGKSKEVYDTTVDVEKSLEKEDGEEAKEPYKDADDSTPMVDAEDFVIEESNDFTIHPDGADFKLIKKALGEETNYQSLREFLKTTFPGWENHTSEILDAWKLIK